MQNSQPTRAQIVNLLCIANQQIDNLRQLDNEILYALENPVELDEARGKVVDSMRALTGAAQELRRELARRDGLK